MLTFLFISCSDNSKKEIKETSEAYNDGFEVVLIDGNHFESLQLNEAEQQLGKRANSTFLIKKSDINKIEKTLSGSESSYPIVKVDIKHINSNEQKVTVSFHYSKDTYKYSYIASKKTFSPLCSSYSSLTRKKAVCYEKNKEK